MRMRFGAAVGLAFLIGAGVAWAGSPGTITVVSYNLENYVVMERGSELAPKPEAEKAALVRILAKLNPDILGVCEMGDPGQFAEFQKRLASAGLNFTDTEYVSGEGADNVRHLALLSKFPIIARHSVTDASYPLNGKSMKVQRGFLDVTIKVADGFELRCLGVHLKSKRPVPEGEALMRRNEAHLLRQHVDVILSEAPQTKMLVYGDFNDAKNEPTIQEIMGPRRGAAHLQEVPLTDASQQRWTHYWKLADEYARIDYLMFSAALKPFFDQAHSFIDSPPDWNEASDHRALVGKIRLP